MALVLRPPSSRESLTDDLADLARTRKVVAVAAGLLLLVGLVLGCVALAAILDVAFHLPPLVRALALVGTLTLGGVIWLRRVAPALALRTDALAMALELEARFPILNDALASAVSFLDAPDGEARGVSNRLQAAAVRSARRLADRYEFRRMIPAGACWRAAWACGLIVAVIVPLVLVDPGRATTALMRLAEPFSAHPWPTKTRIEILAPAQFPFRMPKGDPFQLQFVVRGVIPDHATVTFRLTGGDEFEENYPLAVGNDPGHPSGAIVTAKIDPNRLPGPFFFRLVANDAETGWREMEVVPPPRLVPLDGRATPQYHVVPPAYTGLAARDLPEGATELQLPTGPVPVGTRVTIRGATDIRLASSTLIFLGDRSPVERASTVTAIGHLNPLAAVGAAGLANAIGADVPLVLDPGGRIFTATFTPSLPGTYAIRLTDETGLTGTRTLEIPLTMDPSPTVSLARPAPGKDAMILNLGAAVPVQILAKDTVGEVPLYAVRRVFLEYRVGRDAAVRTIPLRDVRDVESGLPAVASGLAAAIGHRPVSLEAQAIIPLSAFKRSDGSPVRDGDTLWIRGAADDWDDVTPVKSPGRSEGEVEIHIASADSIEAWLQRELAGLRTDLIRLRDRQRDARNRTLDVTPLADGTLAPADRDRLLGVQHQQDEIGGKIKDSPDGLAAKAAALRETIRANNLPRSTTTDRVNRVADELSRLKERDIPAIKPSLSAARELGAHPPRKGQEHVVPDLLRRAERHQKEVEDGLTNLLDLLDVWGGASAIRGEARALRDLLNRMAGDTDRLADRIPARPASELTTTERGELDRMGSRVEQVAEQSGSVLARAARQAEQRERTAALIQGVSAATDILAGAMASAADATASGEPRKSALNAQSRALRADADDLRGLAGKTADEALALRRGIHEAGGQTLPNELRQAADALRNNRQAEGAALQRSAAARLARLADALAEKPRDEAPDLMKWKRTADELNSLADAQDNLRKQAIEAARISDPMKRSAELKRLAGEQDRLLDRGKELLQRLTREGADGGARDARVALDRMETARDQLEQGNSPTRAQNDAVDRLDSARDRLDRATANPTERLADEKRRKMADRVKALHERQNAAIAEAERIHKVVVQDKEWRRPVETSYVELSRTESNLAEEVAKLEADFAPLPVLARVVADSGRALKNAADRITTRLQDIDPTLAFDPDLEVANDRKVLRPMTLAARRLAQLLEALKTDDPKSNPRKDSGAPPPPMPPTPGGSGGDQDLVPPLAQLKILKALQAELNQDTAEFARAHPDPDKLTDEERDQLKDLEQAQREIATLFEEMARLFDEHKAGPEKPGKLEKPETEKKP